ncbi:MAG: hypothetical protein AAF658_18675, partial [Myxococcota bacterium]
ATTPLSDSDLNSLLTATKAAEAAGIASVAVAAGASGAILQALSALKDGVSYDEFVAKTSGGDDS